MQSALLAIMLLWAATPSDQFDLICKPVQGKRPIHYRVDLAAGEFCWEQCEGTIKIASVTSTRIVFIDKDSESGRATHFVDRATGEWHYLSSSPRWGTSVDSGYCEAAPFSGFGAGSIKF